MSSFIGAGGSDEALIAECLDEAVDMLRGYVRHLRQIDHDQEPAVVTGEVVATKDTETSSWTWTDTREMDVTDATGPIPASVLDRATREVCSDLFARRQAPGGILNTQFAGDPGTAPARLHRDPLTPAYPLLSRWVVPF